MSSANEDPEPAVERIVLLVEFADGSSRRFTARRPADYVLAVRESPEHPQEPRITVTFAGNPEAGGMQVSQSAGWPDKPSSRPRLQPPPY